MATDGSTDGTDGDGRSTDGLAGKIRLRSALLSIWRVTPDSELRTAIEVELYGQPDAPRALEEYERLAVLDGSFAPPEKDLGTASDGISVVLIDDHDLVAESVGLALSRAGITVVGRAAALSAGLALVADLKPDVVILDYRLPDGDALRGVEALVRAEPSVAVVILTAVTDHRVAADLLRAGALGYVTKDGAIGDLVAAVTAATEGRMTVPPGMLQGVMARLRSPRTDPGATLTPRERQALQCLCTGSGIDGVAELLGVSRNTARKHIQAVLEKLGAHTQLQAVAIARREGLLNQP